MQEEDRLAATPARAASIAGASARQIEYWRRTGLVTPSLARRLGARTEVRIYNVSDLVELRVVGALRGRGMSLQNIRKVVARLRQHYESPLRELKFAHDGSRVYIQHPDGSWEDGVQSDQLVIYQVIPLAEIRVSIVRAMSEARRSDSAGKIARRRGVRGSQPVFEGTRVPVSAVRAWLDRGASDERIREAYPELTVEDLEAARLASAS